MIKTGKKQKQEHSNQETNTSGVGLMPPSLFGNAETKSTEGGSGTKTPPDSFDVIKNEKIENNEAFIAPDKDENKIHHNDVEQGQVADCFLAAALATVAMQNPELIENAITPPAKEGGNYKVKLYKKTSFLGFDTGYEQKEFSVSPEFAIAKRVKDGKESEVDAHMGIGDEKDGKKEIWPLLIEKAYAMMIADGNADKGIEKLNKGGDPALIMEALSGKSSSDKDSDEVTLTSLEEFLTTKQGVTFVSLAKDDGDGKKLYDEGILFEWHIYYLLSVDKTAKTITLGNPWGEEYAVTIPFADVEDNFRSIKTNPLK